MGAKLLSDLFFFVPTTGSRKSPSQQHTFAQFPQSGLPSAFSCACLQLAPLASFLIYPVRALAASLSRGHSTSVRGVCPSLKRVSCLAPATVGFSQTSRRWLGTAVAKHPHRQHHRSPRCQARACDSCSVTLPSLGEVRSHVGSWPKLRETACSSLRLFRLPSNFWLSSALLLVPARSLLALVAFWATSCGSFGTRLASAAFALCLSTALAKAVAAALSSASGSLARTALWQLFPHGPPHFAQLCALALNLKPTLSGAAAAPVSSAGALTPLPAVTVPPASALHGVATSSALVTEALSSGLEAHSALLSVLALLLQRASSQPVTRHFPLQLVERLELSVLEPLSETKTVSPKFE